LGASIAASRSDVTLDGRTEKTEADANGDWKVRLPAMKAGGPHKLVVQGNNRVERTDILTGEVWIGSGQSNMQWTVAASKNGRAEAAGATHPKIRLFLVPNLLRERSRSSGGAVSHDL
jgi:sialate O-acetylesterase